MKLSVQQSTLRRIRTDGVAVFVRQDKKYFIRDLSAVQKLFGKKIDQVIKLENFKGKEAELISMFTEKKINAPRLFIAGLGEEKKLSLEQYRRASAAVVKKAKASNVKHLSFSLPAMDSKHTTQKIAQDEVAYALAEGAILAHYNYDKYFTEKKDENGKVTDLTIFDSSEAMVKLLKKRLHETRIICEATYLARDLENAPSNEIFPETLAEAAQKSAAKYGYRAIIWDKKRIEQAGFGGLLAVNSGSHRPPRFIILEYNSGQKELDTIVLIGKGITFDTGGISIKPANNMAEMKMDMSGAAAVIGTFEATARLKLPIHLVGLIPATENMPSGSAMKPGDIITHYGGKTSEVDNTDAEGRLILADPLAYAATYKPKAVIDLATLTGACVVALGHHATGMMGNDKELMEKLKEAGEKTYERVWQLPLFEEYEKQIKSDVADVKNTGGGKGAGAITAALFLKKFIGDYKWVHLDIAGTAILEEALPYAPKGGSGVGVRLLVEFLKNWKK
ncbi:MAG: leucyl aminopeptidase [Ignavibacteriae bacterium]|nr:leucyl aminopeptidase [Ignavibacteriota bacterium]